MAELGENETDDKNENTLETMRFLHTRAFCLTSDWSHGPWRNRRLIDKTRSVQDKCQGNIREIEYDVLETPQSRLCVVYKRYVLGKCAKARLSLVIKKYMYACWTEKYISIRTFYNVIFF